MRQLLIGPPGSGKTQKLISLIEEHSIRAEGKMILALSFSKTAARELGARSSDEVSCFTMHSYGNALLKGVDPDLQVLSAKHMKSLADAIDLETKDVKDAIEAINKHDTMGYTNHPSQSQKFIDSNITTRMNSFVKNEYDDWRKKAGLVSFSDMLQADLMKDFRGHLLVLDEAQDCTWQQWQTFKRWSLQFDNVIVAGDPNQAMYVFAGADPYLFCSEKNFYTERASFLGLGWRMAPKIHEVSEGFRRWIMGGDIDRYPFEPAAKDRGYAAQLYEYDAAYSQHIFRDSDRTNLMLARTKHQLSAIAKYMEGMNIPFSMVTTKIDADGIDEEEKLVARGVHSDGIKAVIAFQPYLMANEDVPEPVARKIHDWYSVSQLVAKDRTHNLYPNKQILSDFEVNFVDRYENDLQAAVDSCQTQLRTYHGSKGMSADCVVVDSFMSKIVKEALATPEGRMEERQNYYVAITRARYRLHMGMYYEGVPR